MIEEAGAEDRRIDGLPGERVDSCPGEPLPAAAASAAVPASGQTSATRTSTVG